MEVFQVVCMQDVPRRPDDFLLDIQLGLVGCDQVAVTHRRLSPCKLKGASNMVVDYGAPRLRAGAFGAILNVDPTEVVSLMAEPWQVRQYALQQAYAGGLRQQSDRGRP